MAEVQWIKIYIDMFDKRKIKKLRRLPEGNNLLLIWVMLLSMAGKCNAGGMIFITENIPYTEEDLADELDFEISTIKLALASFKELRMAEITDDGFINILGWEEYQNIDRLAELRAKDRERKRLKRAEAKAILENSENVHGQSTDSPDIEEDKEGDKEKEFHSFFLAKNESSKLEYMGGALGQGVVLLSEEQKSDLLDKLSIDEFNKYVGIIRDCELKGLKYKNKSHYQAILEMVENDRKVNKRKKDDTLKTKATYDLNLYEQVMNGKFKEV
jgi:predicted phage replisome organizer